jgi:hypothetical protein
VKKKLHTKSYDEASKEEKDEINNWVENNSKPKYTRAKVAFEILEERKK